MLKKFLCSIKFSISLGTGSTLKLSKYCQISSVSVQNKATQYVNVSEYSSRFIT